MYMITDPADTESKLNVHKTSRNVQDVFWTSYVRPIYALCLRGKIANVCCNTYTNLPLV